MTKNQDGGTQSNRQQETEVTPGKPTIEVTPSEKVLIPERIARNSRR